MNVPQADQFLPTNIMRVIGAARTYAQRMQFFLGVPNTLMIGVLFYNDNAVIQSVFPTVYHWVGFILFVVVPSAILVDRTVLHPAQITYTAHQNAFENRSPGFRIGVDNNYRIKRIEEALGVSPPEEQSAAEEVMDSDGLPDASEQVSERVKRIERYLAIPHADGGEEVDE